MDRLKSRVVGMRNSEGLWTAFNSTLEPNQQLDQLVGMLKVMNDKLPAWVIYFNSSIAAYTGGLKGPGRCQPRYRYLEHLRVGDELMEPQLDLSLFMAKTPLTSALYDGTVQPKGINLSVGNDFSDGLANTGERHRQILGR